MSYREIFYKNYCSKFKKTSFDEQALTAKRIANFNWAFRNWLPENKNASIIDLACGDGVLLQYLKKIGFNNIYGIDISPEQAKKAKLSMIPVEQGCLFDFLSRQKEAQFDLITGLDIVEHFTKEEVLSFLKLCNNTLKPGGNIILKTPNADTLWGTALRYGDFTHENIYTPKCLASLLVMCGFIKAQAREETPVLSGYSFKSSVRYVAWHICRLLIKMYNLIETGGSGSNIYTRVFWIMAEKPPFRGK